MAANQAETETSEARPGAFGPIWPQLRAALIAAHLVALSLAALPRVNRAAMSKSARQSPTARAEIDAWAERLAGWGVEIDAQTLERGAVEALESWLVLRTALNAPFGPYIELFGLDQPWLLFPGADGFPARMVVEIERDGAWQPVQTMYPISTDWRARLLRNTRAHGEIYAASWPVHRRRYVELGRWLALQAARDFPRATRVRISIERTRMLDPDEVRAGAVAKVRADPPLTFELERAR